MATITADPWHGIDGAAFEALAGAHGTPFFLYDADAVNARIHAVREALADAVEIYYAVKSNPNLALLRAVGEAADGLDISSGGELQQALLAGFDAARLSFAGPAKTDAELTDAITAAIGAISVESLRELHACVRIAGRLGVRANVVVRVNPLLLNRSFGIKMGGRPVQFGIDEEDLAEALAIVAAHPNELAFQGVHIYAGSQCFDPAGIVDGVANTFRIVAEIEASTPLVCRSVNLGGGFGVSHVERDRELELAVLGQALGPVIAAFVAAAPVERRIVFELGRYLTAEAGIYVARVVSSKSSRGKRYFMVDGGLHHHLAAAGTFGAALRGNFVLQNLTRPGAAPLRCQVAGPSCNPTDLLGVDIELAEPQEGDLIAVLTSGSYGLTASPMLFLGRPTPAELVRTGGVVTLGRRPRTVLEFN